MVDEWLICGRSFWLGVLWAPSVESHGPRIPLPAIRLPKTPPPAIPSSVLPDEPAACSRVRRKDPRPFSRPTGRLVEELVQQSDLHVIAVDEDAEKVAALRPRLYDLGLYGTRASVLVGDPVAYPFAPYLASLVVSETPDALEQAGDFVLLVRSGALPGSTDWSHAEANAANTGASEDELRDPSAVLWFDASRWHRQPGHLEVRVSGGRQIT